MYKFREHSFFFHFQRRLSPISFYLPQGHAQALQKQFQNYFLRKAAIFSNISIETEFFIVPSGHFGQTIYLSLQKFKDKMLGFLDNDQSKIGKRLYGTHLYVYAMKHIEEYKTPITVVIHAGPYLSEIKNQLLNYNSMIQFIEITL